MEDKSTTSQIVVGSGAGRSTSPPMGERQWCPWRWSDPLVPYDRRAIGTITACSKQPLHRPNRYQHQQSWSRCPSARSYSKQMGCPNDRLYH